MITVEEKVINDIAGKWWLLSSLGRIMNIQGEKVHYSGVHGREEVRGAEVRKIDHLLNEFYLQFTVILQDSFAKLDAGTHLL